jgi:hypothetical protein
LVRGRGSPARSTKVRKRRSSSLLVTRDELGERPPQATHPGTPRVALEQDVERGLAGQAERLGSLQRAGEPVAVEHGGQVEQRPRDRGDRDALHRRPLVGRDARLAHHQPIRVSRR